MTKKNFVTLVLSTIGGLLFSLGMCMALLPEWNLFTEGVVMGAVGFLLLLVMLMVRRKMSGKPAIEISGKTFKAAIVALIGVLLLGIGMSMVMVWEMLISGILIGIFGIVILLFLIPVCNGLK